MNYLKKISQTWWSSVGSILHKVLLLYSQIRGTGNDRIIGIFYSTEEESQSKVDFLFVKTAIEILYQYEGYTLPRERFQCLYQQNICKNKNIMEDDARLDCFPSCVVVSFCLGSCKLTENI
jgi:hypothetical protein